MRSNRFIAVVLVLGSVMALSSCTPFTKIAGNSETLGKLEGSWVVKYVAGKELEGVRPELTFDTAKGALTGFDGCNRLNGTFAFEADRLKAKTAATRMACPNEAARQASAAINDLINNGAEVIETAIYGVRVLMMRNASAEIRMWPIDYAK